MKVLQIIILSLGLTVFVNGQNAILIGNIYDQNGALIPDAVVEAKSKDGREYTTKTNDEGQYEIKLPFGLYDLVFSANLFENYAIKKYKVVSFNNLGKMFLDVSLEARDIRDHRTFGYKLKRTVYDHYDAVIHNVEVVGTNKNGEKFNAQTNDFGVFFLKMSAGFYDISVESPGFCPQTKENINVSESRDEKLTVKFKLKILTTHIPCEGVVFTGNEVLIEDKTIKISNKISTKPLEELPKKQNKNKRKK